MVDKSQNILDTREQAAIVHQFCGIHLVVIYLYDWIVSSELSRESLRVEALNSKLKPNYQSDEHLSIRHLDEGKITFGPYVICFGFTSCMLSCCGASRV